MMAVSGKESDIRRKITEITGLLKRTDTHDFDEVITFIGNNVEDPYDLGGEIEFWLEDEPQIITRSSIIFVPKGMKHAPLIIRRVDRPIFHTAMGTGGIYLHNDVSN